MLFNAFTYDLVHAYFLDAFIILFRYSFSLSYIPTLSDIFILFKTIIIIRSLAFEIIMTGIKKGINAIFLLILFSKSFHFRYKHIIPVVFEYERVTSNSKLFYIFLISRFYFEQILRIFSKALMHEFLFIIEQIIAENYPILFTS